MNPTDATESNLILRRLAEPLPADLVGGAVGPWPLVLLGLLGAALVAWLFRGDWRRVHRWAVPVAVLRGAGVAAAVTAFAFPGMVIGGWDNAAWLVLTLGGLLFVCGMVLALYLRDARTARGWAAPLALLRVSVYALLAVAFLLPAIQYWELAEKKSRVVLLFDVSPSVTQVSDELSAVPGRQPATRLDRVIDAVMNAKLIDRLLEKNPVVAYRFGSRLDDQPAEPNAGWTADELKAWATYDFKEWVLRGLSQAAADAVRATPAWQPEVPGDANWAVAWAKTPQDEAVPAGLPEADAALLAERHAGIEKRVDVARSVALGTNVPESVTALLNREAGNLVQAVVIFSDGRSNLGSESAYNQLRERASAERVPVFTVAVGEPRDAVGITITDVQSPDRAPPDEAFKLTVEADGVGLAGQTVDVTVGLYGPGQDPKTDAPDFDLPAQPLTFAGDTNPPHGLAEFVIDPEKLPESLRDAAKKPGGKPVLKQGEWYAVARIAKDKREAAAEADHKSLPRAIQVLDKPTRVLLFASGPTREYQTLRTLLVRETQANRAELSICLQTEGGREGTGVQDVSPERLLSRFPTRLEVGGVGKADEKFMNLNEYDLIIAFDPDWSELSPDQIQNVQTWVDNLGGGLIYVAGPLHTFQLARGDATGRLKPLLDILPVVPDDIILVKTRPIPRTPRRLLLKPNPEYEVLALKDEPADEPTAGWEPFFTGNDKFAAGDSPGDSLAPKRGFYSYYPVKGTKPGATTLAEFLDVGDRGEADPKPWLVTTQPARGRTVFVGSGETWRLRAYDQDFFDRFWVKLTRFASGNRDAAPTRGRILIGKEFTSGSQVRVQARVLSPNGQPYDEAATPPKFRIEQYDSSSEKVRDIGPFETRPRKSGGGFDGYYAGQVLADPSRFPPGPGHRYRVVMDVPDSPGDTIAADFTLKKSDPELDSTRPDFAALDSAAGTLDEVRGGIKDAAVYDALRGAERDPKRVKLAYRLGDGEKLRLIPDTLDSRQVTARNRGPVRDLWDRPAAVTLGGRDLELLAFDFRGRRVEVGWLLFAVVTLLCVEWTARKLLRLA